MKRGEKRGKEKVKRCRIMRVSVWECNFIEHKYKRDRRDYIFFLQQSIYNTKSHRNSTFNTQILRHKKVHTLEYKLISRVVCESCSDF